MKKQRIKLNRNNNNKPYIHIYLQIYNKPTNFPIKQPHSHFLIKSFFHIVAIAMPS